MAGTLPPLFIISEDDHAGYVCVATYTLLVLMLITVVARVFSRWYIVRLIKSDDIWLLVASLLATLQSILVQLAVNHGLGRKEKIVSSSDFNLYQKYEYAAQMLLIATIACGKISLISLVQGLIGEGRTLLASRGIIAVVIGWTISSILALAFQCSLPHPWDSAGQCIDQDALFNAIAAMNIVTDIALVLLPCTVFWRLRVSRSKRWRIIALFATRIIVCGAAAIQMHYFRSFIKSSDKTWASINSTMWNQAMMNLSIIATAIPSLGRLIVELQPTINAFAITDQHGLRSTDKYTFSTFTGRFPNGFLLESGCGTDAPGRVIKDTSDSTKGLTEDGIMMDLKLQ